MPQLDTSLHLEMFNEGKTNRANSKQNGIYGLEWDDPEKIPPLGYVRDHFLLPYISTDTTLVEIGVGGGRWTQYMLDAAHIYAVDYHQEILNALKSNFNLCNISFIHNNGDDFPSIPDASVDFIFSFGTFVHLDLNIIDSYLKNIRRLLKQHSNVVIQYSDKTKPMAKDNKGFSDNDPDTMRNLIISNRYAVYEEDTKTLWHSSIIRFGLPKNINGTADTVNQLDVSGYINLDNSIAQAMTCKGWTSPEKLTCLARLLNQTSNIPGDILEIGSAWGRSAIFMATYSPKKIWSIDPHTGGLMYINSNTNQDSYEEFINNLRRCNVYNRVSLLIHTTEDVLLNHRIPDNIRFSLVFIDGLHTPAGVDLDVKLALQHLTLGGVIAFDDYFSPEFRDYAHEIDLLMESMRLHLIKDESGLVYCTIDANSYYAINDITLFNYNSSFNNYQPNQDMNNSSLYNHLKLRGSSPMRSNLLSKIK